MKYLNEQLPKRPAAEPTSVEVWTVKRLNESLQGDFQILAEFWAMDSKVLVVVDEVIYRVFELGYAPNDSVKTDVVNYDPVMFNNWAEATSEAMAFGAELSIALTKLAIG